MTWVYLALIGMFIWSITAVVDRFALNERVSSKRFYTVIPAFIQLPLVILFYPFFAPTTLAFNVVAVGIFGGVIEALFLYYLYVAISKEEVSRVFMLASVGPLFTLFGGWILLGETLSGNEFLAMILFISGGAAIAFKKESHSKNYKLSKGVKPALIGIGLVTIYTLALRYTFVESDFATGFFFSRIGFFMAGSLMLLIWRKEIINQFLILQTKLKIILIANQVVAFSGHAFYFSALALASAALVESVLSIQGLLIFIIATIVSYFNPKLISERITKHDLIQKGIALLFIIIALNLLL